ncbi:hypothetical protein Tco_1300587 [Tanacetum coccineum]
MGLTRVTNSDSVTNRKSKGNGPINQKRNFVGLRMPNPKPNLKYQPVKTTNKESKPAGKKNSYEEQGNGIKLKNLFEKLNETYVPVTSEPSYGHGVEVIFGNTTKATQFMVDTENKDSDSEVEEVFVEDNPYKSKPKEASTSYDDVSNVYICAVLESHVDISSLSKVCSKVFRCWDWTSNGGLCPHGCRIIVGWNVDIVQVMVIAQSTQALHVKIVHKASNKTIFCSFIYAGNKQAKRRVLWRDLGVHKHAVRGLPWILKGDFNVALNMEDTYSGSSSMNSAMCDGGFLRKLDRIMSNEEFINTFPGAYGLFQPYRISDHSPAVLKIPTLTASKPKPFKFYNFLAFKSNFLELVDSNWTRHVDGHDMFKVALDSNHADLILREEKGAYVQAFNEAKLDEERFLKQKAKLEWLDVGNLVPDVFVSHYEQFLGTSMDCNTLNVEGLFSKTVPMDITSNMVRSVTNEEIKAAMFDIGDEKAPGPDGYTSVFFKKGWSIIGPDICNAVHDFFSNGKILKEINHTFLALIPKVATPLKLPKKKVPPRCAFKLIFKKLTDTVDWTDCWIAYSDSICSIILMGDPLSPYLFMFMLVMEILILILKRRVRLSDSFRFHRHCEEIQLINVCFADDLFIFARGDAILNIMPFSEGELPVKYIGVPLISSRLLIIYYKVLVEKAKNRIGIIDDIHQLIRGFVWCNGESIRGKAKVSWDEICLPKKEGGLGLRHLYIFNYALMTTHIWNIVSSKESLWNKVADLIVNGVWAWPQAWLHKALDIGTIAAPILDVLQTDVGWFWIVWFSHNIPRHAFHLWLVIRQGLKTHDRMKQWDVGPTIDVNLLRCSLSDMDLVPPVMHDIILHLQPMGSKRTARCIFGKLIVAAVSYFIWLERNNRIFKNVRRSLEEIRDILMVTVLLKLLSLRFKNTDSVRHLLSRWKMPKNFRIYG